MRDSITYIEQCRLSLFSFAGGRGGEGGRGIKCKYTESFGGAAGSSSKGCDPNGQTNQAARGPAGDKGTDGQS